MSRGSGSLSLFSPPHSWRAIAVILQSSLACLVPEAEQASTTKLVHAVLRSLNSLNFIILGSVCLESARGQREGLPTALPGPGSVSPFLHRGEWALPGRTRPHFCSSPADVALLSFSRLGHWG